MNNRIVYLGEICTIKGGKRLPKGHELLKVKTTHPYIKARDIGERIIQTNNLEYISEGTYKHLKRYTVSTNDVCITIVGANVGDVGIVPQLLEGANLTENAVKLTNFKECDPIYISYILCLEPYKRYMELVAGGSAQPKLGLYKIQKILLTIPSLHEQNLIASILSNYDDLIEVNNQRIKLLAETAQELYKEWFVRMRFPGYKATKFEKGIPSAWNIVAIGKVIDYSIGGGWGNDDQNNEFLVSAYVIRGTDIPKVRVGKANREVYRFHKASNVKSRELIEGDIVFETAGGSEGQLLGRTCYITKEILSSYKDKVIAASFCKLIRTESISSLYLYYFINYLYDTGMIETYQTQSTGISNYQFEPFLKFQQIIVPEKCLMQSFHDKVLVMQKEIAILGEQNTKLRGVRDRLLPRLISGKLKVKIAEDVPCL